VKTALSMVKWEEALHTEKVKMGSMEEEDVIKGEKVKMTVKYMGQLIDMAVKILDHLLKKMTVKYTDRLEIETTTTTIIIREEEALNKEMTHALNTDPKTGIEADFLTQKETSSTGTKKKETSY
jgi:hypothetical protein